MTAPRPDRRIDRIVPAASIASTASHARSSRVALTVRRARAAARVGAMCLSLALLPVLAHAHDAITSTTREFYLSKLGELDRTANSGAAAPVRAEAWFQIGGLLDEIRELLNGDIASHGRTQGLETALLLARLDASPHRLNVSLQTKMYLAPLQPLRDALALDPQAAFANAARFKLLKGQFYDSFGDDPLKPWQTREQLLERIALGEGLLRVRERGVDAEEVSFILAMHYLQARAAAALPAARVRERFTELLRDFRRSYPQSLKLATLEALGS
jgi:hypothetical protein